MKIDGIKEGGFRSLSAAELEVVSGGQAQFIGPVKDIAKWFAEAFVKSIGSQAGEQVFDEVLGTDPDDMLQREQAINPQFDPSKSSITYPEWSVVGQKYNATLQGDKLFIDMNGNRAWDAVVTQGENGWNYIDYGDGRGPIGYPPGSEPWHVEFDSTTLNPNLGF